MYSLLNTRQPTPTHPPLLVLGSRGVTVVWEAVLRVGVYGLSCSSDVAALNSVWHGCHTRDTGPALSPLPGVQGNHTSSSSRPAFDGCVSTLMQRGLRWGSASCGSPQPTMSFMSLVSPLQCIITLTPSILPFFFCISVFLSFFLSLSLPQNVLCYSFLQPLSLLLSQPQGLHLSHTELRHLRMRHTSSMGRTGCILGKKSWDKPFLFLFCSFTRSHTPSLLTGIQYRQMSHGTTYATWYILHHHTIYIREIVCVI